MASYRMVELGLGYSDGFDGKLCISMRKLYSAASGQKTGSFRATFTATGTDGGERRFASATPTNSGVSLNLGMLDEKFH